jgi:hypothetical protein
VTGWAWVFVAVFRRGFGRRVRRGPVGVVVVLPFLELLVEQAGVILDDTVKQSVEPFGVDAVGTLDFSVEPGSGRPDVDMADALIKHVSVEAGLEFGAVVGLDLLDLEGQS